MEIIIRIYDRERLLEAKLNQAKRARSEKLRAAPSSLPLPVLEKR